MPRRPGSTKTFRIKRIYDSPAEDDGCRMLVDRLWPRGVTKAAARVDVWAKVAAPSTELRKWFHANAARHEAFAAKYMIELEKLRPEIEVLLSSVEDQTITLLTATKEPTSGHVPTLKKFLEKIVVV